MIRCYKHIKMTLVLYRKALLVKFNQLFRISFCLLVSLNLVHLLHMEYWFRTGCTRKFSSNVQLLDRTWLLIIRLRSRYYRGCQNNNYTWSKSCKIEDPANYYKQRVSWDQKKKKKKRRVRQGYRTRYSREEQSARTWDMDRIKKKRSKHLKQKIPRVELNI